MAVGDSMRYQKYYVRTLLADIHVLSSFHKLGFLYIKITLATVMPEVDSMHLPTAQCIGVGVTAAIRASSCAVWWSNRKASDSIKQAAVTLFPSCTFSG